MRSNTNSVGKISCNSNINNLDFYCVFQGIQFHFKKLGIIINNDLSHGYFLADTQATCSVITFLVLSEYNKASVKCSACITQMIFSPKMYPKLKKKHLLAYIDLVQYDSQSSEISFLHHNLVVHKIEKQLYLKLSCNISFQRHCACYFGSVIARFP